MPLNITVTNRGLKNNDTGIDMYVNSYEPASTPKLVKNYRVVIISNLPHFKLPRHGEGDVVQFMALKDYEAFEKLQKDVTQAFPDLKLPSLPRKFHLFVSDSDIEERQVAFDCLLKVLAKDKTKCVSAPVLQFLGFSILADREYYKKRKEFLQKREEEKKLKDAESVDVSEALFGKAAAETNDDLFGDIPLPASATKPLTGGSIFDDDSNGGLKRTAKVSLLADDLFLTGDTQPPSNTSSNNEKSIFETEDNSEILNVPESLDDVLKIINKPVKGKAATPIKVAPLGGGGLFDIDDTSDTKQITSMDSDDITKYIQQNQETDDDLDLFG